MKSTSPSITAIRGSQEVTAEPMRLAGLTLVRHCSQHVCADCKPENDESEPRRSGAGIAFGQHADSRGQQDCTADVTPEHRQGIQKVTSDHEGTPGV